MTKYEIYNTHAIAYPSNLVSQHSGHIQSVTCSQDMDNGSIIALGDFIDLDLYEDDGTVAGFTARVEKQAANGNWYVRVLTPGNAYFVFTEVIIPEEWTTMFQSQKRFFNAKDEEARAYQLFVDDVFEVSEEAFAGTPTVGASIASVNTDRKMVIA